MAQLSDDCFAQGGPLMRLDEALSLARSRVMKVVEDESASLDACCNRILAADVRAGIDVPGKDNSAVDGYAVYFDDLQTDAETRLKISGRATAGHPFPRPQARGTAVRIFTGALMPEGPDTVMMQEDCRIEGDDVIIRPGIKRGANRRLRGEDITSGDIILRAGQRLRPQDVALAASIGMTELTVVRPLRVGIFSTGDELRNAGDPLPDGAIYDSNRPLVAHVLRGWGCAVTDLGILRDDRSVTIAKLKEAAGRLDLIVTSGGVSMGEEDHVRAAIEANGRLHFWKLAIKPGRPIAMGQIESGDRRQIPVIGLPGNPVAAFVTLTSIGRAIAFALMGANPKDPLRVPAIADFKHRKKLDRREWLRARIVGRNRDGWPVLQRFKRQGAGILSSLADSDGLAEVSEEIKEVEPGQRLDFTPYSELF